MMGIDRARCLRAQMTGAVMSEQVKQNMPQLLGCELCQAACPANSQVGETETPQQVRGAFDLKRLLEGNTADALELVGKNLAGKLAAETLVMAGRSGDASFIPLIENWLGDEREGVADAAKWAIEQLG
jgi:epoxyqueuosine reductase QueG